ncbi:MAG: methyltransferase [Spirochaetales bacterium]|nr:methyltransferase [Spirochaetales bacterium]
MAKKNQPQWEKNYPSTTSELVPFYSNKIIPFRYDGADLNFFLSQALFSSFEIDPGSRLLLKTIAQNIKIDHYTTLLDIGCGIGTLGLCLKKRHPHLQLHSRDRDALALAFTLHNARHNKTELASLDPELGLDNLATPFDLIISNLPAKAGPLVLENLICGISQKLSSEGTAAIVIVKTLVNMAEECIKKAGGEILFSEGSKEHHVFHYRGTESKTQADFLEQAQRTQKSMKHTPFQYNFNGFYGLQEFDTLHYKSMLALGLFSRTAPRKKLAIWNPGAGHFSSAIAKKYPLNDIALGSRDLLSLKAAEHNLKQNIKENAETLIHTHHEPSFFHWQVECQSLVIFPEEESGIKAEPWVLEKAYDILPQGGQLAIIAKSVNLYRILEAKNGWEIIQDKKSRGFRGIMAIKS